MLPYLPLLLLGTVNFLTVSKYIVLNHLLDQTWEAHDISPCYVFAFNSLSAKSVLAGEKLAAAYSIST
jgi:hypothetical protein